MNPKPSRAVLELALLGQNFASASLALLMEDGGRGDKNGHETSRMLSRVL